MNVFGCSCFTAVRLTFLVTSIYIGGGSSFASNIKCGANLTIRAGSTGKIKSPRFPLNYPNDVDCEWKIRVEAGSRIKLTFTDFEVECKYDFLEVYNGGTKESSNQVAKLCGSSLPGPIEFNGNELLLRFHSDSSVNFKGFKLRFATTGECGGDLRTSTGVVKSPRFPLNYPDDVDCEWKIRVEEGSRIKLTFIRFEVESGTECEFDSLEIYNGGTKELSNRVAKLCGTDLPDPIESSGKDLILRFHSDSSVNIKGFKLRFASIVPSQAPDRFLVTATSSTSIRASWQVLPADHRNGIIRGYKLLYKKRGSVGSPTILVINDGTTVNKTVTGLDKFTEYVFQVWAFTSVGDGRRSSVYARTKEDVPSQAPVRFLVNATTSTSIRASWQLPPAGSRNGIIVGYKLFYKKRGSVSSPTILLVSSGASTLTETVTGLAKYTEYEFQVLAFTSVGDGPKSSVKVERTKEDGKRHQRSTIAERLI